MVKEEETESRAEKVEKPFQSGDMLFALRKIRTNLCLKKLEILQGTFQVSFIFRYITFDFLQDLSN